MIIKVWEICKNAYLFYFPYSIEVDEALYCIVWYGPLMVVCLLYCHYICVDYGHEGKLMNIWRCAYDDTMWRLCLLSYSSCDLGCMNKCWSKGLINWWCLLFLSTFYIIVMLMKPCITLCGMVPLWWWCLLYSHYICVDHCHEG